MNKISGTLLAFAVVATGVAVPASAGTPIAINVPVFLKEPVGIVLNPNNDHIYVLDIRPTYSFYSSGYVHIIDAATNKFIRTITMGQFSKGIVFDGYHNKVYVTNSLDNTVGIIDTNNDFPLPNAKGDPKTITLGINPAAIAFSYYTSYTYVTYKDNVRNIPAVAVIDGASDSIIGTISGFDRDLTALTWPVRGSIAHLMYALGGGSPANVYAIQPFGGGGSITKTTSVGNSQSNPFPVMYRPMASENTRDFTYVVNEFSNSVSAVDGNGNVAATIPVGGRPVAIAGEDYWTTGGGHVFVACKDAGTVVEITERQITRTWSGFNNPTAIQYNPRNHSLYVADARYLYVVAI